jgi:flagellar protein FlaG
MEPYVQMNIQTVPAQTAQAPSRAVAGGSGGQRREETGSGAGQASPLNAEETRNLAAKAETALREQGVDLKFVVSEDAGQVQVEIHDAASDKLIRKVPQDELLQLQQSLKQFAGVLYNRPV